MKKVLPIANGIALVLTIAINYLSNTGLLNGSTMKTYSDKYANYFTPEGYAFSIWGLIYLGLLGFVIYTSRDRKDVQENILSKIGWWFVVSCIANSLWVVAWLYDYTGLSVLIMTVLLVSLLQIIRNTRMELDVVPTLNKVFIFWPFALYSGWISVAIIANIAAFLTKIEWSGWGLSGITWTIIMIAIACLINIAMVTWRKMLAYGLVGIWALMAIAVANKGVDGALSIVYACYAAMGLISVFWIIALVNTAKRTK